ncbi:MAG: hypothetical protein DI630_16875 [Gordonia sp. (in: high G+C Gram-positive bacteria)]|nr:MAG: hypothetical protein DI630_16875 [Gordonia sp. (in: high G+C Gram-positive bacteria)]
MLYLFDRQTIVGHLVEQASGPLADRLFLGDGLAVLVEDLLVRFRIPHVDVDGLHDPLGSQKLKGFSLFVDSGHTAQGDHLSQSNTRRR